MEETMDINSHEKLQLELLVTLNRSLPILLSLTSPILRCRVHMLPKMEMRYPN
jgi:hypothetical protein